MRILDNENDKSLNSILICLTLDEAKELYDSLENLILKPKDNHTHIMSECSTKEASFCIYEEKDLDSYSNRIKKLIVEDN